MKNFVLVLLLLPLAAAADMYKWVDKDGSVHYSQTPPAAAAERISVTPPPTAGAADNGLKKFSDNYDKQAKEQAKKDSEAAAKQQERSQKCAQAKAQLDQLQNSPLHRLAQTDDSGNVSRMTPEQQQQLIAAAQENIGKNCDN
jgi:hypothetical protein